MCNLYSNLMAPAMLRAFFADLGIDMTEDSLSKNYEPGYVGADQDGLVIRWEESDNELEIASLRWGFPAISKGKKPITNIRNLDSRWWKDVNGEYLTNPIYRCLVPFDKFAEWSAVEKENAWFKTKTEQSFFAGIWRGWNGERLLKVDEKKNRVRTNQYWELYSFLTTEPNEVVAKVHPKAMPVIFTSQEDCSAWLRGGEESFNLQRPLQNELMERVY